MSALISLTFLTAFENLGCWTFRKCCNLALNFMLWQEVKILLSMWVEGTLYFSTLPTVMFLFVCLPEFLIQKLHWILEERPYRHSPQHHSSRTLDRNGKWKNRTKTIETYIILYRNNQSNAIRFSCYCVVSVVKRTCNIFVYVFSHDCWIKDDCRQIVAEHSLSVHKCHFKNKSGFFLKLTLEFWKLSKQACTLILILWCHVLPVSMAACRSVCILVYCPTAL